MSKSVKYMFLPLWIVGFSLFILVTSEARPPIKNKNDQKNVLIFQIRGLTYEMLERAYTPNIKYLIKNGFLGSMKYRNPEDQNPSGRRGYIKSKIGDIAQCLDSIHSGLYTLNSVGSFNDTIIGPFNRLNKNYRSNESMVKDFINNKNGTNVRLAFLSFRNFSASSNYLDREQINELSTIDSLIGVVFKSYQEKVKWENTTVFILSNGIACHKYQETELYKNTPIVFYGSNIPIIENVENMVTAEDALSLIAKTLGTNCANTPKNDDTHFIQEFIKNDSTNNFFALFVPRPDIISYSIPGKNMLEVELQSDNESSKLYYTTDSHDPRINGIEYRNPFYLKESGVYLIKAASNQNGVWSPVTQQSATLRHNIGSILISPPPDPKYTFNGVDELIDGDTAELYFAVDKWLGFQGKDVDFFFDFGNKREISTIDVSTLQDNVSWIFLPRKITFFIGNDRNQMIEIGAISHKNVEQNPKNLKKHYTLDISTDLLNSLGNNLIKKRKRKKSLYVKYLLIHVEAQKTAPDWFSLPGAQVWFFTDEIKIE